MTFVNGGLTVVPGVGSPMEARLVAASGFDAVYVSGYAASGMMHGLPDIGLMGLESVSEVVRRVRLVTELPIIVDADTGYGDVSSVRHTVRVLEAAGANAIQIEDQKWPKRCGHLEGKLLEERDVAKRKVAAAVKAKSREETRIIARTDALAPVGLEEALSRIDDFEDADVDMTFVDAPPDRAALQAVGSRGTRPRVVNMSESGKTPILPSRELHDLGFSIALYPTSLVRAFSHVGRQVLAALEVDGSTTAMSERIDSLDAFNELVRMDDFARFDDEVAKNTSPSRSLDH